MGWERRKVNSAVLTIRVDEIVGKQRPRFDSRNMRTYTPSKTVNAERTIADAWLRKYGRQFATFAGEVHMHVTSWRCLAKSNPKMREGQADLGKPDGDNICKLVQDALNGIAFKDDAQITYMTLRKMPRIPHVQGNHVQVRIYYYEEEFKRG